MVSRRTGNGRRFLAAEPASGGVYAPGREEGAARNNDNVMPSLVEGALHNCTLGEMVQAMADVYGRYSGGPEW